MTGERDSQLTPSADELIAAMETPGPLLEQPAVRLLLENDPQLPADGSHLVPYWEGLHALRAALDELDEAFDELEEVDELVSAPRPHLRLVRSDEPQGAHGLT